MERVIDAIHSNPGDSGSDSGSPELMHAGALKSTDTKMTPENGCPLLQLPGELRNRIYELVFVAWEGREIHYLPTKFFPTTLTRENRMVLETCPLKRVCRQMRMETLEMQPKVLTGDVRLHETLRFHQHHSIYSANIAACVSTIGRLVIELPFRQVESSLPGYGFDLIELGKLFAVFRQYPHAKVLVILANSGLHVDVQAMLQSGAIIEQAIRTPAPIPGASQKFRKHVAHISATIRAYQGDPEGDLQNVVVRYGGEFDEKLLRKGWYPWCKKYDKIWVELVRRWYKEGI